MPHVSSRKTPKGILEQIYKVLFITSTSRLSSRKKQELFFNELFTPTEKIMLGKRIGAIALLNRGVTPYRVGNILKMSDSTTNILAKELEKGGYKQIAATCNKHRKGSVERYLSNLLKPLPRYGTGPSSLFKDV